ncbi:Fc.00g079230.m01.CDS01 [Cosmosporella sp. VM-42]
MYSRLTTSLRQNLLVKIVSGYAAFGFVLMEILFFAAWCRPFHNYWQVPPDDLNCSAETNHMITNAVINISSDIMIIALPMPVFLQSQLPTKRKVVLCAVFALGIFAILAATLSKYYSLGDPYGTDWIYWYIREVSTAIITANLPFTWTLLQRVFRLGSFSAKYGKSSGQRTGETKSRYRSAYGNLSSQKGPERTRKGVNHDTVLGPSESQERINDVHGAIPLKIFQMHEVHISTEEIDSSGGRVTPQQKKMNQSPTGGSMGDKPTTETDLGVVTKAYRGV